MVVPQIDCIILHIMGHPIQMDDLGVPLFQETFM